MIVTFALDQGSSVSPLTNCLYIIDFFNNSKLFINYLCWYWSLVRRIRNIYSGKQTQNTYPTPPRPRHKLFQEIERNFSVCHAGKIFSDYISCDTQAEVAWSQLVT